MATSRRWLRPLERRKGLGEGKIESRFYMNRHSCATAILQYQTGPSSLIWGIWSFEKKHSNFNNKKKLTRQIWLHQVVHLPLLLLISSISSLLLSGLDTHPSTHLQRSKINHRCNSIVHSTLFAYSLPFTIILFIICHCHTLRDIVFIIIRRNVQPRSIIQSSLLPSSLSSFPSSHLQILHDRWRLLIVYRQRESRGRMHERKPSRKTRGFIMRGGRGDKQSQERRRGSYNWNNQLDKVERGVEGIR